MSKACPTSHWAQASCVGTPLPPGPRARCSPDRESLDSHLQSTPCTDCGRGCGGPAGSPRRPSEPPPRPLGAVSAPGRCPVPTPCSFPAGPEPPYCGSARTSSEWDPGWHRTDAVCRIRPAPEPHLRGPRPLSGLTVTVPSLRLRGLAVLDYSQWAKPGFEPRARTGSSAQNAVATFSLIELTTHSQHDAARSEAGRGTLVLLSVPRAARIRELSPCRLSLAGGQGLRLPNLCNARTSMATWNRTGIPKTLLLQPQNTQASGCSNDRLTVLNTRARCLASWPLEQALCLWFKLFHVKYMHTRGTRDKEQENQRG